MEGRGPAAHSPSQAYTPRPCARAAQRRPGREPASAQCLQAPEKGASVPGLLGTGGVGAEGEKTCQTLPGWRPRTPRTKAQAWERGHGRSCLQPPPFKWGGARPRHRGVTGRVRRPQISRPVLLLSPSSRPARRRHAGAGPWWDRGAAAFARGRYTESAGMCSVSKAVRVFIMLGARSSCG